MHEVDSTPIQVLARGLDWLAVCKPSGVAMHPSYYSGQFQRTLVQLLSAQLGCKVHLVHRLDAGTSGVVLVALSSERTAQLSAQFAALQTHKHYLAVCRGWLSASTVEHALTDAKGRSKAALTAFTPLARASFPWPDERFQEQRYCLVDAQPTHGRQHQIRRHLKHISHPLIGDVRFGKGEHNRWFRERLQVHRPLLHAWSLELQIDGIQRRFTAPLDAAWQTLLQLPNWEFDADSARYVGLQAQAVNRALPVLPDAC